MIALRLLFREFRSIITSWKFLAALLFYAVSVPFISYVFTGSPLWIRTAMRLFVERLDVLQTFMWLWFDHAGTKFAGWLAIIFVMDAVVGEKERASVDLFLSKPIRRSTYYLTKLGAAYLAATLTFAIGNAYAYLYFTERVMAVPLPMWTGLAYLMWLCSLSAMSVAALICSTQRRPLPAAFICLLALVLLSIPATGRFLGIAFERASRFTPYFYVGELIDLGKPLSVRMAAVGTACIAPWIILPLAAALWRWSREDVVDESPRRFRVRRVAEAARALTVTPIAARRPVGGGWSPRLLWLEARQALVSPISLATGGILSALAVWEAFVVARAPAEFTTVLYVFAQGTSKWRAFLWLWTDSAVVNVAVAVCALLASGLIAGGREGQALGLWLAKPITRAQFLALRLWGSTAALAAALAVGGVVAVLAGRHFLGYFPGGLLAVYLAHVVLLCAFLLALATFVSSCLNNPFSAALATFVIAYGLVAVTGIYQLFGGLEKLGPYTPFYHTTALINRLDVASLAEHLKHGAAKVLPAGVLFGAAWWRFRSIDL